ncbi:MAG: response regulator [Eubacterium sp.]|nr:response regulator [Eubacterium sp.]
MKALVVDDNKVSALELSKKLELLGVDSVTALNGEDALDIFKSSGEGEFDFIFMDIMMPEKKGTEVAARIRQADRSDARKIPIIAVTGITYDVVNRALEVSGISGVLKKPIDMDLLKSVIGSAK